MKIFKNKYSEVRSGWKIALSYSITMILIIISSIIISIVFLTPEVAKNGGDITAATLAIESNKFY